MKHYRGNMLLIELVIVLLFFSLSQVIVVQVFAAAQKKTADSGVAYTALTLAQDVAERLSCTDDPQELLKEMGFAGQGTKFVLEAQQGYILTAEITKLEQPAGILRTVMLTATRNGEVLFAFPSTNYEEAGQ